MRKSDLKKNHAPFDEAVARYRAFMEKVVNAQRVIGTAQEKRDLAESVLLRLCANWEYFMDEHLIDCINCEPSVLSKFFGVTIPDHPGKQLCQALLMGDSYRDFRSFGDLKGFSKRILPESGNPFLAISTAHSEKVDEVYKIRNYLSHYSGKAQRALRDLYKNKYDMDRFLEPGQFLLAYNSRRLWAYFDAFEGASNDMKGWY
jgi:hypothetical protein